MHIQFTPYNQNRNKVSFNGLGSWAKKVDNTIGNFLRPVPMLSETNQKMLDTVEIQALKKAKSNFTNIANLSVRNGSKEFIYNFKNTPWQHFRLMKKGREVCSLDVLHVRGSKDYDFYTTGTYVSRLSDKKSQKNFNEVLEEWLPKLIKRNEKLEKNALKSSNK